MQVTDMEVVMVTLIINFLLKFDAVRGDEKIYMYVDSLSNVTMTCPYQDVEKVIWRNGNILYASGNKFNPNFRNLIHVYVDKNTGLHNLRIERLSEDDSRNYTCSFNNKKGNLTTVHFYVFFRRLPSDIKIIGSVNETITTREGELFLLTCNVTSGNPPEHIKWKNDDGILLEGGPGTLSYTFTPKRTNNLQKFECIANNSANYNIAARVFLNVQWKPNVSVAAYPSSVIEGGNVTIVCEFDSNPSRAEINWYFKDKEISKVTTFERNHGILANIQRNQSGYYRCKARNNVGEDQHDVFIDVKYPPTIKVEIASEVEQYVIFICTPHGNPDNYSFSAWEHVSVSGDHIRYLNGSSDGRLLLSSMTDQYLNSGWYICNATNGINLEPRRSYTEDSISYRYSGRPMFSVKNEEHHFGVFGEPKSMQFYFYSHPELINLLVVNEKYNKTKKVQIPENYSLIEEHFCGKTIKMEGFVFNIYIEALMPNQFSNYTIFATNIKGLSTYSFKLMSANRPETPTILKALPQVRSIVIVWSRNFDGGYPQVFVIELQSALHEQWNDHLNITDGDRENDSIVIDGLKPDELYHIRMRAENWIGKSNFTDVIKIRTLKKSSIKTTIALYGTTLVGLTVLIIAFTKFIVTKRNAGVKFVCKRQRKDELIQRSTGVIVSSENVVMNNLYNLEDINADVGTDQGSRKGQDERDIITCSGNILHQEEHELNYVHVSFESQPSHNRSFVHGVDDRTIYSEVEFSINLNALPTSESDDDSSDDDFIYVDDIVQYAVPK